MVDSHSNRILVLHKWLESMNLEDVMVRKDTSNGRETHKVTNDWKESRDSKKTDVLLSSTFFRRFKKLNSNIEIFI